MSQLGEEAWSSSVFLGQIFPPQSIWEQNRTLLQTVRERGNDKPRPEKPLDLQWKAFSEKGRTTAPPGLLHMYLNCCDVAVFFLCQSSIRDVKWLPVRLNTEKLLIQIRSLMGNHDLPWFHCDISFHALSTMVLLVGYWWYYRWFFMLEMTYPETRPAETIHHH